jgi:pseudoazurin
MQSLLKTLVLVTLFFLPNLAMAADVTIEMLNKQGKESMVYSQKIVNVNVGDTVFWKATTKGHNVQFMKGGVPDGVEKFKSKMNKDTEYTFTVPGIYAYWCTPHKSMGMIGFVVVGGDKSNLEAIKSLKFFGKSKKIAPDLISKL